MTSPVSPAGPGGVNPPIRQTPGVSDLDERAFGGSEVIRSLLVPGARGATINDEKTTLAALRTLFENSAGKTTYMALFGQLTKMGWTSNAIQFFFGKFTAGITRDEFNYIARNQIYYYNRRNGPCDDPEFLRSINLDPAADAGKPIQSFSKFVIVDPAQAHATVKAVMDRKNSPVPWDNPSAYARHQALYGEKDGIITMATGKSLLKEQDIMGLYFQLAVKAQQLAKPYPPIITAEYGQTGAFKIDDKRLRDALGLDQPVAPAATAPVVRQPGVQRGPANPGQPAEHPKPAKTPTVQKNGVCTPGTPGC